MSLSSIKVNYIDSIAHKKETSYFEWFEFSIDSLINSHKFKPSWTLDWHAIKFLEAMLDIVISAIESLDFFFQ